MSIYGLYSGDDGQSHLVELQMSGSGPPMNELLPCTGWRPFQSESGRSQSRHPTPMIGMTIMLGGCMKISVGGGKLREVALLKGDTLLVLDTHGEGHATAITGPDDLRIVGLGFEKTDWPTIQEHFSGWPDNLLAP